MKLPGTYYGSTSRGRPQRQVDQKDALVCARKQRYPDEVTARAAGARSIELHQNTDELHVYRCQVCRGWHLTRFKVGVPIKANNPVAEQDWREQLLALASEGKVQTYRNCDHGNKLDQKWLHEACLTLEQEGKLKRHFEREHSVTWIAA